MQAIQKYSASQIQPQKYKTSYNQTGDKTFFVCIWLLWQCTHMIYLGEHYDLFTFCSRSANLSIQRNLMNKLNKNKSQILTVNSEMREKN